MSIYDWLRKHDIEIGSHQLIDDAFTHTSYVNEHHKKMHDNERLEFMGDAVMQIWVSEQLFKHEPSLSEGRYRYSFKAHTPKHFKIVVRAFAESVL